MRIRISGGSRKGRTLRSRRGGGLRPTSARVRQALFSILGPDAVEGARVLDLYAGTGAVGIEALSRGAAYVDFVEANNRLGRQIREDLQELALAAQGRVYEATVERTLDLLPGGYEIVFADPPYDMTDWAPLMSRLGEGSLTKESSSVVVEHRHDAALADRYGVLIKTTSRRYGDSAVSVYTYGAIDG